MDWSNWITLKALLQLDLYLHSKSCCSRKYWINGCLVISIEVLSGEKSIVGESALPLYTSGPYLSVR